MKTEDKIKQLEELIKKKEEIIKQQQENLTEYYRTEKLIIAAGLLDEEKFEQAREIVRSLRG
jgi:DNA-binding protein H-NS